MQPQGSIVHARLGAIVQQLSYRVFPTSDVLNFNNFKFGYDIDPTSSDQVFSLAS
jgi:hypothetical protein